MNEKMTGLYNTYNIYLAPSALIVKQIVSLDFSNNVIIFQGVKYNLLPHYRNCNLHRLTSFYAQVCLQLNVPTGWGSVLVPRIRLGLSTRG